MEQVLNRIKAILTDFFPDKIAIINQEKKDYDIEKFGKQVKLYEPVRYSVGVYSVNTAFVPSVIIYNTGLNYDVQDWGTAGIISLAVSIDINIKASEPEVLDILKDRYSAVLMSIFSEHPRLDNKNRDEIVENLKITGITVGVLAHSPENHVITCNLELKVLSDIIFKFYGLN